MEVVLTILVATGIFGMATKYTSKRIKESIEKEKTMQLGLQALLRDRLYQSYHHYKDKGFAPIYAKENFANMYEQYHELGANGVMDSYLDKFMELPDEASEIDT